MRQAIEITSDGAEEMQRPLAKSNRPHGEAPRGHLAEHPRDIPASGWGDVLRRVKDQVAADNVSIVAAGLALFGLLSVFPSLAAAVALYGLIGSPEAIAEQVQRFGGLLPQSTLAILQSQLSELAHQQSHRLSTGAVVGFLFALWGARRGMAALITAMNVAYNQEERRGLLHQLGLSLLFALCAVVGFVALVLLGLAVPVLVTRLPLGGATQEVLLAVRWVLLWLVAVLVLSALYRFAPNRDPAQRAWLSRGAVVAATLWLVGSLLFALYVRNFDTIGRTYGALGGIVVMLLWFYVSAFVVLLGAEIDSELERQTVRDTVAASAPLGQHGAPPPDTLRQPGTDGD